MTQPAPVHLVVDARTIRPGATGVGNWTAGIVSGLERVLAGDETMRARWKVTALRLPATSRLVRWQDLRHLRHSEVAVDYESHPAGDWWLHVGIDRAMRELGGDVLLSPAFIGPVGRRAFRRVNVVHDTLAWDWPANYPRLFSMYLRGMTKLSARVADRVVSVSPPACESVAARLGLSRVECVPCGVDRGRFCQASSVDKGALRENLGVAGRERLVLYASSLEERKNHGVLVRALRRLGERARGLRVVFAVGKSAVDESAWKGLPIDIARPGPGEIEEWTRAADLAVFPSRGEGFGLPVLEAMSCGTPLVASDIPSLRWLTQDGKCAPLLDPMDDAAWAEALLALADPAKVAAGIDRAKEFAWEASARRLLELCVALAPAG